MGKLKPNEKDDIIALRESVKEKMKKIIDVMKISVDKL